MPQDRVKCNEWMRQACMGSAEAFSALALAVQDELYRFALAHGLNPDDAAEAAQETLLRGFDARKRWREDRDVTAWLYGIAMNVVREMRRRNWKLENIGLDLHLFSSPEDLGPSPAGPVRAGQGHDVNARTGLDIEALATALENLPDRQREAVVCRYLRRMSVAETAVTMNCATGTVKAHLFAALENLRDALKEESG